jgi:hypothetical protein
VINPDRAGVERGRLVKTVAKANQMLIRRPEIDPQTYDLAAYVALGLEAIAKTIDPTVEAWEKRGYWVKADRFRMDWAWAEKLGGKMRRAILAEDWGDVATTAAALAEKLGKGSGSIRGGKEQPWVGAYERLRQS